MLRQNAYQFGQSNDMIFYVSLTTLHAIFDVASFLVFVIGRQPFVICVIYCITHIEISIILYIKFII